MYCNMIDMVLFINNAEPQKHIRATIPYTQPAASQQI